MTRGGYMNPFEIMEIKKNSFTKKELLIYEYFKNDSYQVIRGNITSLAEMFKVSQPTITRFCQKLGYSGFNDFMFDIYRYQKQSLIIKKESDNVDFHYPSLDAYTKLIHQLDLSLNYKQIQKLAKHIVKARRVIITGMHKSYLSAKLCQYNLIKFSLDCFSFSNDDRQEIQHLVTKDDLVIIFSAQAESCREFINYIKDKNVPIALITMNDKATHRNVATHFVWLPNSKNQDFEEYLENQVIFSLFIDILTSFVADSIKEKGGKK